MLRTKLAKKLLTKKEQKHLSESNIHNMAQMKRQVDFIKTEKATGGFVCFDCEHIAKKLKLM